MLNEKIKRKSSGSSKPNDVVTLQNLPIIVLLKPELDNGKTVLKALKHRKTIREISDKKCHYKCFQTSSGQHVG